MTTIKIDIEKETGRLTFWNDGDIVPIKMHEEEKCYIHSLIFGQLRTSSNYNDEDDRIDISGKNGYGVKLCSVFSKEFKVEGLDPHEEKTFSQTWKNNMRETYKPIIKSTKLKRGYTKVSFIPDYERFGMEGITDEIIMLFKRYTIETSMITKMAVLFNGEKIEISTLSDYARLYVKKNVEESKEFDVTDDEDYKGDKGDKGDKSGKSITSTISNMSDMSITGNLSNLSNSNRGKEELLVIKTPTCEVVLTPSDGDFEAIAFSNGICNPKGGVHVDSWTEEIFRPIVTKFNKPKKPQLNIAEVKRYFRLFIIASVKRPLYDGQCKFTLKSPSVEAEVKKTHVSAVLKWSAIERLQDALRAKEFISMKKIERKKRGFVKVEGLDSANNEGTKKAGDCTLILVEGLSAKTYATMGISTGIFGKEGRDWFGILALRGKLLNVRNANTKSISEKRESNTIMNIIQSLGVEFNTDYTLEENYKKLRYGKVLIICDADVDGFHITALIQNLFHFLFPSLLQREEPFLNYLQTPIVRVFLNKKEDILFYNEYEYKRYVNEHKEEKINKKYYKGLGSSNKKDIKETFGVKVARFVSDESLNDTMNKVFHSKQAEARKDWLKKFNPNHTALKWSGSDQETMSIKVSDFLDKELIKFSIADCERSIPNLMDGLKESHRKVLFTCFKRKLNKKLIKVSQLTGSVSERTNYHHGEDNLQGTIIGMACSYVGGNNIPLLVRDGGFGTRIEMGKDASNGRYLHTHLDYLTRLIFRTEDDVLLDYIEEDGSSIEPRFYVPIIPMILVNGSIGIGTGWSCNIPYYNPVELIECIRIWLSNNFSAYSEEDNIKVSVFPTLKPWYRGYKGEIVMEASDKFITRGIVEREKGKVKVTEIPVGMAISKFKDDLDKLKEEKQIKDYINHSSDVSIDFTISEIEDGIICNEENLGLSKVIKTSNMVLFRADKGIHKFHTVDEIIDEFCKVRYEFYIKRKKYYLETLEKLISVLGNKKRFLEEIRDGIIILFETKNGKRHSRSTIDLYRELEKRGYDKFDDKKKEKDDEDEEEPENKGDKGDKGDKGYDYLLTLRINNITAEKIVKLMNDIESNTKKRDELLITTEAQLWLNDLDELEKEYPTYLAMLDKEDEETSKKNEKAKRKAKKVVKE